MKTSESIGPALDWAVCWAIHGVAPVKSDHPGLFGWRDSNMGYLVKNYSTSWEHGGPIIEQEGITLRAPFDGAIHTGTKDNPTWTAVIPRHPKNVVCYGPTALIAAMRCYVASKLGDKVEIPEELE